MKIKKKVDITFKRRKKKLIPLASIKFQSPIKDFKLTGNDV